MCTIMVIRKYLRFAKKKEKNMYIQIWWVNVCVRECMCVNVLAANERMNSSSCDL